MLIYVFDEPIKCFTNPRHQSGFLLPMGHGGSEEDDSLTRIQCCLFTPDVGTKSDYQAFKCRYINLFSCILLSVVNLYLKVICDERKVNKTPSPYQILQYLKSPSCLNFIDRPKHHPPPCHKKNHTGH